MRTHLFVYPGGTMPALPAGVSGSVLVGEPSIAARAIEEVAADTTTDVLLFWDTALGAPPWQAVDAFRGSLDDAWHPGARITGADAPDLLAYVQPLWIYRPVPPRDAAGVISWRIDLRATLVRSAVVRGAGGFDGRYDTLAGMARDLGVRLVRRGAVVRQFPELVRGDVATGPDPTLADRYRLVRRQVSAKWTAYVLARRFADAPGSVFDDVRAWRATAGDQPLPRTPAGTLHRDLEAAALPDHPTVSVILPTYGRYRYVAEVLDDLRAQTVRPTQILIADGTPPDEREPEVYERYRDLPIEVVWHETPGICSGRNALLQRATGEYVWFVDDDSRFDANNLEAHLRALAAYGADVSVGPAYMRGRPELAPDQREVTCSFMDCGTTVVRRELLDEVGGFDMQFNAHLAGEDNDLGIRFIRAGGLMINNPFAKRFHYFAPVGGSRSKGSIHVFRRWSLRPRPVQSVYYLARRHFERSVAWDAMLQASITLGWRRRDAMPPTKLWKARTLVEELLAAPLTAVRYVRSARIGQRMLDDGPQIPTLARPASDQRGRMMPK
ncbi:MAG TPA: glycosyltransferase [Kofleriaceae bacterium]|nr:glycosyltransferase [Kofleriaceae bacterium]